MHWPTQRRSPGSRIVIYLLLLAVCLAIPGFAKGKNKKKNAEPLPVRATLQPVRAIPVGPLGFAPPGELYMGSRVSQSSLDFLDADHLLFTFRIPALMRRGDKPADPDASDERRIRAVVLRLPQGTVEADAIWTVHDRARYLYMLDSGQYLVRDRDNLLLGDASLQLKPFLHFPGKVVWVELDPALQYIVTGSEEPPEHPQKSGEAPSSATASAQVTTSSGSAPSRAGSEMVLRVLLRTTGQVMLVSRVHSVVHVPLNRNGYIEPVHGEGARWLLNFNLFTGGSHPINKVESYCAPLIDFLSEKIFLVTACDSEGEPKLVALTTAGQRLWEAPPVGPSVWPVLVYSRDGARFARETLMATHEVNARAPLDAEDIKGQDVQIIDSATGKIALRAAASPVLDAGGNVAIAPDGRSVVILMEGGLQMFNLPLPPALPQAKPGDHPRR